MKDGGCHTHGQTLQSVPLFLRGCGLLTLKPHDTEMNIHAVDRIFTVSVGGCRQAREEASMNCEIQNYSLGPLCSPHRDSWKNTEVDMGKERGTCVLPFAFFMCVIALLGISSVPVHPKQIICQRATSERPPHFCCPFIYQWTSRPIYYIQFCTVDTNNHGVQEISFLLISFP